MKLTTFAAIAASSAALVGAVPLRVVVVSSKVQPVDGSLPGPWRFGLPAAAAAPAWAGHSNDAPIAHIVTGNMPSGNHRRPCGGRFRQKAVDISNAFRTAFGFPPIETDFKGDKSIHGGMIKIVTAGDSRPTYVKIGEAHGPTGWTGWTKGGDKLTILPVGSLNSPHHPEGPHHGPPLPSASAIAAPFRHKHHHHHHDKHGKHRHGHKKSFNIRVQDAILSLGPWEGRAVAFVLGCGLGALLRMLWVFGVVLYRSFRGDDESDGYVQVAVFEHIEDESGRTPYSAPPAYIYPVDEKATVDDERVVEPAVKAQNQEN